MGLAIYEKLKKLQSMVSPDEPLTSRFLKEELVESSEFKGQHSGMRLLKNLMKVFLSKELQSWLVNTADTDMYG